jgi:hypothetical protein
MTSILLQRAFYSLVKRGLSAAFAAATLASLPTGVQAGLLEMFTGKVAEHVAEHQVEHQIDGHFKSPALVPGRDGPLAPSSHQGFAACPHLFPKNTPIDVGAVNAQWRVVGPCSNHFAVLNSALSKTQLVVVEKLNRSVLSDAKGQKANQRVLR